MIEGDAAVDDEISADGETYIGGEAAEELKTILDDEDGAPLIDAGNEEPGVSTLEIANERDADALLDGETLKRVGVGALLDVSWRLLETLESVEVRAMLEVSWALLESELDPKVSPGEETSDVGNVLLLTALVPISLLNPIVEGSGGSELENASEEADAVV